MIFKIGNVCNRMVFFMVDEAMNSHIAIIGASGSGKTTMGISLMIQAAMQGMTVIALDIHGIFSDEQINEELKSDFERLVVSHDVYGDGAKLPLFTKGKFTDGTEEQDDDVIGRITDAIASSYRFGSVQWRTLREAVRIVYENGLYDKFGIAAIGFVLKNKMATDKSIEVAEKISQFTSRNVFRQGDSFLEEGKINIIRLSKLPFNEQKSTAEVIMSYLWGMANRGEFKDKGIYLFADECHNYDMSERGILASLMREGRRFGVNLILATQSLSSKKFLTKLMMQAGLVMMFRPAANEVEQAAKLVDAENKSMLKGRLRRLKVGQYYSGGSVFYGKNRTDSPLEITVDLQKMKGERHGEAK